MIKNNSYNLLEVTKSTLTVRPCYYNETVFNLFYYLCHFTDMYAKLFELEKLYGPGVMAPEFMTVWERLTQMKILSPETYRRVYQTVKLRQPEKFRAELNTVFSALGMPETLLNHGDGRRQYLDNIDLLDNCSEHIHVGIRNYIQGYFDQFGYEHWLCKKFDWFTKNPEPPLTYWAGGKEFKYYTYVNDYLGAPDASIPRSFISAPQCGEPYTSAWDFYHAKLSYPVIKTNCVETIYNPRHGVYNFYEKEIPKIIKQLGYPVREVRLVSPKNNSEPVTGWETDLCRPIIPLALY